MNCKLVVWLKVQIEVFQTKSKPATTSMDWKLFQAFLKNIFLYSPLSRFQYKSENTKIKVSSNKGNTIRVALGSEVNA